MKLCNWDRLSAEQVNPLISRKAIHTPNITILRLDLSKGAIVPAHQHVHEQVTMLTAGVLRLVIDGEEIRLHPGDVLRIRPNALHLTEALEDSSTLEIFTPARDDLSGSEDANLGMD